MSEDCNWLLQKENDKSYYSHNKTFWNILLSGLIISIIIYGIGAITHQVYDWSGNNQIVGWIFPNKESIWEHIKIIFIPFVVVLLALYPFIRNWSNNYIYAVSMAIFAATGVMILIYYTLHGAFGLGGLAVDLIIYAIAVLYGVFIFYKSIMRRPFSNWVPLLMIFLLAILGSLLVSWSYNYPDLPIFKSQI